MDLWPVYVAGLSSYLQQNSQTLQKWGKAVRHYPDGSSETTIYPLSRECAGYDWRVPPKKGGASGPAQPRDVARESCERAARKVRRIARYQRMRNMLTLTFPGAGVHDYQTAYECVAGWLHYRSDLRDRGGYLVTFELHPSGHGYHAHILFPGPRLMRGALYSQRASWTAHVARAGLSGGHTGVVRTHVKRWSSERSAACYAAKYVSKTFEGEGHLAGRQRYLRSEGLQVPCAEYERFPCWSVALASCGHPHFFERLYDGRPSGRPFIWLAVAGPDLEPPERPPY